MNTPPTLSEIANLPITLDIVTAGRLLGIGRTTALRLARAEQFPCRVLRIGSQWRVPTADLLALLGLPTHPDTATSDVDSRDDPGPPGDARLTLIKDL